MYPVNNITNEAKISFHNRETLAPAFLVIKKNSTHIKGTVKIQST
jgi:hypothetical protein